MDKLSCVYCGNEGGPFKGNRYGFPRCVDSDACRDRMIRIRDTVGYGVTPFYKMLGKVLVEEQK